MTQEQIQAVVALLDQQKADLLALLASLVPPVPAPDCSQAVADALAAQKASLKASIDALLA